MSVRQRARVTAVKHEVEAQHARLDDVRIHQLLLARHRCFLDSTDSRRHVEITNSAAQTVHCTSQSLFFLQNHRINVPLPDFKCRTPRPISCQYHPLEQTSRYSVVRGENKRWMHLNGKLDTKGSDFANKLMYWNLELDS